VTALPLRPYGDELFHTVAGSTRSGRILAIGRDGWTVICDGRHPAGRRCQGGRYQVVWKEILGQRKRAIPKMRVVNHDEHGAILEDERGHGWEEPGPDVPVGLFKTP
jgi:hypothetical protein